VPEYQRRGAAPSGAYEPWSIDIDVLPPAKSNVNFATITAATILYGGKRGADTSALNNEVAWDVSIPAGTYTIEGFITASTNRGIASVQIDGVEVGTIDSYAGVLTANTPITPIAGVVVAASGRKVLKLKITGKNASSSAFFFEVQRIRLRRTA